MNRNETLMTPANRDSDWNALLDYINPLRRWWWLLLASVLVATASTAIATFFEPTQYSSRATVMIGASIRDPNPNSGELYLAQQLVTTYVDLIQRASVRAPAMAALGMDWLPEYTARQVPGTQLMEINVIDTDPLRAQAVGQALIDQLIALSPEGAQEQKRADFIEQELDALQASITETKAEIERRQSELANMFSARQIADAQNQIDALQSKLSSLQTNFTALLSTTQKGAVNTITVIEPPAVGTPVSNNLLYKLLTAAAIGFVLAAGGAHLIEFLDKSFKNSDEIQQRLGLATLGAVPEIETDATKNQRKRRRKTKHGKSADSGASATQGVTRRLPAAPAPTEINPLLVMLQDNQSPAAEAFRVLRTNIQFAAVAHPVRSLVVSSALPSEGKSLITANLAIAAAQAGNRVVVLDCDLHRPRQHHIFGLGNGLGVTTALLGMEGVTLEQFMQPGPLPNLRVMTSGPLPPNAAEMLGSERMRALIKSIAEQADLIVIDSPPASVLADTAVLSRQADGVLLVLHAGRTDRDVVKRTVAALQQVQAHIVGVVLNRMPTRGHGYYYYHYYYYYNYDYSRKYYRRDDQLVGGAIPVTPARPTTNGATPAPDVAPAPDAARRHPPTAP